MEKILQTISIGGVGRKLYSSAIVLLLVFICPPLKADYIVWRGTVNNQWHLADNWSPAVVPGPADIAVIEEFAAVSPILTTVTTLAGIRIESDFTIAAGSILNLRGLSEIYAGTLVNNGTIRHESEDGTGPPAAFQILETGKLVNNGTSIYRNVYGILLRSNSAIETLENNGVIELYGDVTGLTVAFAGIRSVINRGTIYYRGSGRLLQLNEESGTTFTNSGRIVATGQGISSAVGSQIINQSCGVIDLRGGANYANGGGITNNAGLILMNGSLTNSGTFLNTGVLRAASFPTYTNQGLQINNNSSPTQIFEYGSPNSFTVSGIYKDSSDVNSAGTFTAPNSFTPNSPQPLLFVQAGNGTCSFYVPFVLDVSALPVKLASFRLSREGNQANLFWSTTSESNSSHFEVEHSTDAKGWQNIGNVDAHGETNDLQTYNYTHINMHLGINYYRLKMVDWDDSFTYSRIVSTENEVGHVAGNFYPNPTAGPATIDLHLDHAGLWTISATDLTGRIVYQDTRRLDNGLNKVSIPRTGPGTHLVRLINGRETIVRKIAGE